MSKQTISYIHIWLNRPIASAVLFVYLFIFSLPLYGQVTPAEGRTLNYRIIGFSFPGQQSATTNIVEIATGNFYDAKDFAKHITKVVSCTGKRAVIEVASFGTAYTWQVVCKKQNVVTNRSKLYHFKTGTIPPGSGMTRLRISTTAEQDTDAYILVDDDNLMYDQKGNPVWYMPETNVLNTTKSNNIKITPSGTFTLLAGGDAFEISYSGKILWHARSDMDTESGKATLNAHHEFRKLNNGHYMVLLAEKHSGVDMETNAGEKRFFPKALYNRIVEFDAGKNIVWSWESAKYMKESDLGELKRQHPEMPVNMHENAFYFNEKDSVLYVNMSGVSRIVKVQYPSGKVLGEYGNIFKTARPAIADSLHQGVSDMQILVSGKLFSRQHALKHSDGYLYVYNNKSHYEDDSNSGPQVLKLKESGDSLEKVWEFDCNVVTGHKFNSGGGGNVMPLPDNSLFVSMSSPYGDIFIVNENKKLLWHAVTEIYEPNSKSWTPKSRYRASIVSRKQMEQMVWNDSW